MSDLTNRLRELASEYQRRYLSADAGTAFSDAADEIEHLAAENAELREFHDMVVNWNTKGAKECFAIMDKCKKYETNQNP